MTVGGPRPDTILIDSVTYTLAVESGGRIAHTVQNQGRDLSYRMDFRSGSWGMGETVAQTPTGYYFTDNMDLTKRGIRLSPTITEIDTNITLGAHNDRPTWWWEAKSASASGTAATQVDTTNGTPGTLTDSRVSWVTNQWAGSTITCNGKTMLIASNTATVITGATAWVGGDPGQDQAWSISGAHRYVFVTGNSANDTVSTFKIDIENASGDGADSVTTSRASTPNSGTGCGAGRPEHFGTIGTSAPFSQAAYWFKPISMGSGSNSVAALERLTTIGTPNGGANDTWTQVDTANSHDLLLREDAIDGVSRLIKSSLENRLSLCNDNAGGDGPLDDANWAPVPGYAVGSYTGHAICTGGASHAGVTMIAKRDGLYAFDNSGSSYPVIPFLQRGVIAQENGWGTFGYGSTVYYNEKGGLWEVRNVTSARPIGPDEIKGYTSVTNITAPIRFQHLEGCAFGGWRYFIYADPGNSNSYILAMESRNHPVNVGAGDRPLPVWHTIIKRTNRIRGIFIDSGRRLWWGEPAAGTGGRVEYIQLADDGSPDGTTRGNVSSTYEWYGPELDATHLGMDTPEITLQFRSLFVEVEGGTANCSWQLKHYNDGGTVNSIGSAITTTSTTIQWPLTSSAELTASLARRIRLRATATTNGSHSTSTDPKIIRMTLYARSPDVVRVVITQDTPDQRRTLFDAEKILRKLKNIGPVSIREPGTNESRDCYIDSVDSIWYNGENGPLRGIEVTYRKYTVNI